MCRHTLQFAVCLLFSASIHAAAQEKPSLNDLLVQARSAFQNGQTEKAVELATRAIEAEPKKAAGYALRGAMHEALNQHAKAVADFDRALAIDPEAARLYDLRGSEHFKLGHIEKSIADFDKFIELDPIAEAGHWKRGISYYYAGQFDKGIKQFEGYQTVDDNDVENAVWRFLCMARKSGVEKARQEILKIKNDRRVPMMQVYALYAGTAEPADVLRVAKAGEPSEAELNRHLFYAHLYLGLYFEATGDKRRAQEHINASEKHKIGHYMWDVAHVHAERLREKTE